MTFSKKLLTWYHKHGRHDLPWQENQTAYRVWISEIMLQQTQVTTVIPYYQRFMARFPNVTALATAPLDEVLSHWSGLGYYARARNIHKTACIVHAKMKGEFPATVEELSELPGIGRSTAGAIIGFSQQKKAVILDGNVKRVLTRVYAIKEPVNQTQTVNQLWKLAEKLTPTKNAHHYNQALMDLGATLCTRTKPRCVTCPLSNECEAYQTDNPLRFPVKMPKKARPIKNINLYIFKVNDEILIIKRPPTGIWGGLWCFPDEPAVASLRSSTNKTLPVITHQLTHFTMEITPHVCTLKNQKAVVVRDSIWYKMSDPLPGGVPKPISHLLKILQRDSS